MTVSGTGWSIMRPPADRSRASSGPWAPAGLEGSGPASRAPRCRKDSRGRPRPQGATGSRPQSGL